MKTLVTRLVVATIVATCAFAPTTVRGQEQVAPKSRVDFRFKADSPTTRDASFLTASRNMNSNATIPRRKMSTGARVCLGMAIGAGAGLAITYATGCYTAECAGLFYGMIGGGGVVGYLVGR